MTSYKIEVRPKSLSRREGMRRALVMHIVTNALSDAEAKSWALTTYRDKMASLDSRGLKRPGALTLKLQATVVGFGIIQPIPVYPDSEGPIDLVVLDGNMVCVREPRRG